MPGLFFPFCCPCPAISILSWHCPFKEVMSVFFLLLSLSLPCQTCSSPFVVLVLPYPYSPDTVPLNMSRPYCSFAVVVPSMPDLFFSFCCPCPAVFLLICHVCLVLLMSLSLLPYQACSSSVAVPDPPWPYLSDLKFLRLSSRIFRRSEVFLANFHGTHEFLTSIFCCWCPCWCYYCCWLVSTISGILAIACLFSAVDVFLKTFWRISAEHMSCWHPYCAFCVPADTITVVG
jgi:hypothetical protein